VRQKFVHLHVSASLTAVGDEFTLLMQIAAKSARDDHSAWKG